jgi:hypothetical protein
LRSLWTDLVPVERRPVVLAPIVRVDDLDRPAVGVHTGVNDVVGGTRAVCAHHCRDADSSDDHDGEDDDESVCDS